MEIRNGKAQKSKPARLTPKHAAPGKGGEFDFNLQTQESQAP